MKKGLLIFLMMMIVSLLVSCSLNDLNSSVTVNDFKSLQVQPSLYVKNFNGNVTLISVDEKAEEGIIIEKVAKGIDKQQLETFLHNKVDVEVYNQDSTRIIPIKKYSTLPEGIKSVAVNLTIKTMLDVNDVEIITSNGNVEIRNEIDGILNLTTTNGDIVVNNAIGQAYLISDNNGSIEIEFSGSVLEARAKNGSIDVRTNNVLSMATLRTDNGDLTLESSKIQTGIYDLDCINGNITVSLPEKNDLAGFAATVNGTIWCERTGRSETNGELVLSGQGEAAGLDLDTINGDIDILISI